MNRQQAKDMLPFITAFAEGKRVQFRSKIHGVYGEFIDLEDPGFDHPVDQYRIAPEIRKRKFRVAYMKTPLGEGYTTLADHEYEEKTLESHPHFVKWLTPRIEYEVEVPHTFGESA